MNDVVLQLLVDGVYEDVDIDKGTTFSFKLQASDLSNPTATKNTHSFEVKLPRTKRNSELFNHCWRIDSQFFSYNPIERNLCRLYIRQNKFFDGYIKLNQIDEQFSVTLFGGIGDYFYTMKELRLLDLPFGDLFTHTINKEFIYQCWTSQGLVDSAGNEVLTYAMTYQGQYDAFDSDYIDINGTNQEVTWVDQTIGKQYSRPTLDEHKRSAIPATPSTSGYLGEYRSYYQKPMIRLKTIIEKILDEMVQYGWQTILDSTFFSADNPYWDKTYVMLPNYPVTSETTYTTIGLDPSNVDTFLGIVSGEGIDQTFFIQDIATISSNVEVNITLPFRFNATLIGDIPPDRLMSLLSALSLVAYVDVVSSSGVTVSTQTIGDLDISQVTVEAFSSTTFPIGVWLQQRGSTYTQQSQANSGGVYGLFTAEATFNIPPTGQPADDYTLKLYARVRGSTIFTGNSIDEQFVSNIGFTIDSSYSMTTDDNAGIRSGSEISFEELMQSDVTCYDFLMEYCRIFGLYFEKDEYEQVVTIQTRKTFFQAKEVVDWTYKLDRSQVVKQVPVDIDYKIGIFQWSELNTKYEEQYKSRTGRDYGSLRFNTGYELGSEEYVYYASNIFNNCIIATDFSQYYIGRNDIPFKDNKIIPHLQDNGGAKVDNGFILVFKDGFRSTSSFLITDDSPSMVSNGYQWLQYAAYQQACSTYPKVSRYLKTADGVYSLNFGRPQEAYNDEEVEIISEEMDEGAETIYVKFWQSYLQDRFSYQTKLLTGSFLLTADDVRTGVFRKFIQVDGSMFVLVSVDGFNPVGNGTTQATLVRVQDINAYLNQTY